MYQVVLSGDLPGLYLNSELVASDWQLRKVGHDMVYLQGWTQANLAKVAKQVELYFSR